MSDCFVRQVATLDIISNVTGYCASCYDEIIIESTIFYDMKNCCYLCVKCQEALEEKLDNNCEVMNTEDSSLF